MTPISKVLNEFHISHKSRDLYNFDASLFSISGNVVFTNFHAVRAFTKKMNDRRDLINFPEQAVQAGQINAMGLIDEIMHLIVGIYRDKFNSDFFESAYEWLLEDIGQQEVEATLIRFAQEFPPLVVYKKQDNLDDYIQGNSIRENGHKISNRVILLEEMLMLWLANKNPANAPYRELFEDESLISNSAYYPVIAGLIEFFEIQPLFGPDHQNLIDMLRSPAIAHPHSLSAQLDFIRSRWGSLIGKYLFRLLSGLDLISEEEKIRFGVGGGGDSYVLDFVDMEREFERFSPDSDWMPNLILIAKNVYVWLDQLSKKYGQNLYRLDQIPEEELDRLSRWGFSGLWLIGLWERSKASKIIKQMRGNPEAVASAYSLFSYDIASDLGGEEAYQVLRDRAWERGIRLASDMVPNHMGIDSLWTIEHPDWFLSLDYSPFPSYTFYGPNLSWDERVGIYLEDHYFDNSDAAVVFKRVDFWTGSEKYIYHGNDGTSMPWNDTAQLDYLNREVREAVIQTILHVARKFPIIRFDAAMTLAKKHYQRLWYPEPGGGGDIPSRAENGLTKPQFDDVFPEEFWREVVDRVAQEVPDTLLLAEAFWLMEGYFVRTLGMHRVYNSAFMNMLRDEKNQEYRLVIKNTLEFDPEILKRFVNFMNNPDERTTVDQFGKDDKYFGICTMMVTMPGLPMFGHGQIEGFTEKYGMEYRKAYWDESPDDHLIDHHKRIIFPLLKRRYLFSGIENFLLFDLYGEGGRVIEDVFVYSNGVEDERALVIYNNKFADAAGWIRISSSFLNKSTSDKDQKSHLIQKGLGEGLRVQNSRDYFIVFRDHISGLEYLRNNGDIYDQGLFIELGAYQHYVFLDFREIQDNEWGQYAQLAEYLNGRGVPNIDEALKEIVLQPVLLPFRELVNAGMLKWIIKNRWNKVKNPQINTEKVIEEVSWKIQELLGSTSRFSNQGGETEWIARLIQSEFEISLILPFINDLIKAHLKSISKTMGKSLRSLSLITESIELGDNSIWTILFGWVFTHNLGRVVVEPTGNGHYYDYSRSWVDEWLLGKTIAGAMKDLGIEGNYLRSINIIKILISLESINGNRDTTNHRAYKILVELLNDQEAQNFLGVNRYQGVLWFNHESFNELCNWICITEIVRKVAEQGGTLFPPEKIELDDISQIQETIKEGIQLTKALMDAEMKSGFRVDQLIQAAREKL